MVDWNKGGWTGSINRWAHREVKQHFSSNPVARKNRNPVWYRFLQMFFSIGRFWSFFMVYAAITILFTAVDMIIGRYFSDTLQALFVNKDQLPRIDPMLFDVSSYLAAAQVGLLAIISLPLALVTLIAQRENSSTDVRVYYNQSFAFELVASCIALLVALSIQIVWPIHTLLNGDVFLASAQQSKIWLSGIHLAWLLINLVGFAHFVDITFGFVQQSTRERLREQYTANVVLPQTMTERLRQHLYGLASQDALGQSGDSQGRPGATFGFDFGSPYIVEFQTAFDEPVQLRDVHMIWVQWVVHRWVARCLASEAKSTVPSPPLLADGAPQLWFTPRMDCPMQPGTEGWCRRRGGVPLTVVEKFVLRRAFRFGAADDDA